MPWARSLYIMVLLVPSVTAASSTQRRLIPGVDRAADVQRIVVADVDDDAILVHDTPPGTPLAGHEKRGNWNHVPALPP